MAISRKSVGTALYAVCACFGAATVAASEPEIETLWACFYNGQTTILCELVQAPVPLTDTDGLVASLDSGSPLPSLVGTIADRPLELLSHVIRIPMHSPAEDFTRVEQLADSIMCATNPSCRVQF